MLRFTDPASGYVCTIHSYQWGYVDEFSYVERDFGTTDAGARYRQVLSDITGRTLRVRFVGTDVVLDQLQMLTMLVLRHGGPVQFHPDDAVEDVYRWLVWPQEVSVTRVVENREEVELALVEQNTAAILVRSVHETVSLAEYATTSGV
jgi:hypothetical protein